MCVVIIRNNSFVGGCTRAESNPSHWARHALLHMAAECVNHSATKAGVLCGLNMMLNSAHTQSLTELIYYEGYDALGHFIFH